MRLIMVAINFLFCFYYCCLQDFPQFHHISSGDLLRSHVRDGTALGRKAKQYMDDGKLVPDNLMIDLVMDEATPHLENNKSLLLDGFPRTVTQARALEDVVHVDMVINLDVPTETIVERIADRCVCIYVGSYGNLLLILLVGRMHPKADKISFFSSLGPFLLWKVDS
jgi:adenylate kinase family enzyme